MDPNNPIHVAYAKFYPRNAPPITMLPDVLPQGWFHLDHIIPPAKVAASVKKMVFEAYHRDLFDWKPHTMTIVCNKTGNLSREDRLMTATFLCPYPKKHSPPLLNPVAQAAVQPILGQVSPDQHSQQNPQQAIQQIVGADRPRQRSQLAVQQNTEPIRHIRHSQQAIQADYPVADIGQAAVETGVTSVNPKSPTIKKSTQPASAKQPSPRPKDAKKSDQKPEKWPVEHRIQKRTKTTSSRQSSPPLRFGSDRLMMKYFEEKEAQDQAEAAARLAQSPDPW